MKKMLPLILFLFLSLNIVRAQATDSAAPSPTESKPTTKSTKRPDLNNLLNLTGQKAPNFVSVDMNGTEYNLEKLRGKIVVINLWATWCVPCIEEMPELNKLVDKFGEKDVVFLAATTEDKPLVEEFLKKTSFSYENFPNALQIVKQYSPKEKPDPETGKSRTIQALPTHIVINQEGIVVKHIWGFSNLKVPELSQTIEQLSAAQQP